MKRQYMKPAIRVVAIQHRPIVCTSPGGYNNQSLGTYRSSDSDKITDNDIEDIF